MNTKTIELPRFITIGENCLEEIGSTINNLGKYKNILIVSGVNVKKLLDKKITESLENQQLNYKWVTVKAPTMGSVSIVRSNTIKNKTDLLIGIGGGKSVDVAKLVAHQVNKPYISAPTTASHDGISSPFASIKGLDRPYSANAKSPIAIIADLEVINKAPDKLIISGCSDLLAKITALEDWKLAHKEKKEKYIEYAAKLAMLSAEPVLDDKFKLNNLDNRKDIVISLITSGIASGIAGSSRPCSGSEHLFAHATDLLDSKNGLHGEKCGIGTIMMAKLHNLDWEKISDKLDKINAPNTAKKIGLSEDTIIKALVMGYKLRPDRYTILHKVKLDNKSARKLARDTNII